MMKKESHHEKGISRKQRQTSGFVAKSFQAKTSTSKPCYFGRKKDIFENKYAHQIPENLLHKKLKQNSLDERNAKDWETILEFKKHYFPDSTIVDTVNYTKVEEK